MIISCFVKQLFAQLQRYLLVIVTILFYNTLSGQAPQSKQGPQLGNDKTKCSYTYKDPNDSCKEKRVYYECSSQAHIVTGEINFSSKNFANTMQSLGTKGKTGNICIPVDNNGYIIGSATFSIFVDSDNKDKNVNFEVKLFRDNNEIDLGQDLRLSIINNGNISPSNSIIVEDHYIATCDSNDQVIYKAVVQVYFEFKPSFKGIHLPFQYSTYNLTFQLHDLSGATRHGGMDESVHAALHKQLGQPLMNTKLSDYRTIEQQQNHDAEHLDILKIPICEYWYIPSIENGLNISPNLNSNLKLEKATKVKKQN